MDRRSFLRAGTLGVSGVAAGSLGCTPALGGAFRGASPPGDVGGFLERFDLGQRRLDEWTLSSSFPDFQGDPVLLDTLGRKSMRTLFTTGMFGDLPIDSQVDPRVQERVWAVQPVMDDAVDGMSELLRAQTEEDHRLVQETLRNRPDLMPRIVRTLDEEAARSGLSEGRRAQFRSQLNQVAWRLEHQPPPMLIDEYLTKSQKLAASDVESDAYQRWLLAQLGEEAFWQEQEGLRERRISRGLRTMGIGVLVAAAGGLLVLTGVDGLVAVGLVGATVGSIMLLIGLVRLLIGLGTSSESS